MNPCFAMFLSIGIAAGVVILVEIMYKANPKWYLYNSSIPPNDYLYKHFSKPMSEQIEDLYDKHEKIISEMKYMKGLR